MIWREGRRFLEIIELGCSAGNLGAAGIYAAETHACERILQELPHVFVLVGNLTDVLEVSGRGNVQLLWDV